MNSLAQFKLLGNKVKNLSLTFDVEHEVEVFHNACLVDAAVPCIFAVPI